MGPPPPPIEIGLTDLPKTGGALAPPFFDRSVNPISTRGDTLSPPSTTSPPGFSDLATALYWNGNQNSWERGNSDVRVRHFLGLCEDLDSEETGDKTKWNVLNSIMLDKYAYKITNEICIFFSILLFLCLHVQIIFFSNQILSIKVRKKPRYSTSSYPSINILICT